MIKDLIGELSRAESEKESKLKSIFQRLIERFCENHIKWRQFISTVAGNVLMYSDVLNLELDFSRCVCIMIVKIFPSMGKLRRNEIDTWL